MLASYVDMHDFRRNPLPLTPSNPLVVFVQKAHQFYRLTSLSLCLSQTAWQCTNTYSSTPVWREISPVLRRRRISQGQINLWAFIFCDTVRRTLALDRPVWYERVLKTVWLLLFQDAGSNRIAGVHPRPCVPPVGRSSATSVGGAGIHRRFSCHHPGRTNQWCWPCGA